MKKEAVLLHQHGSSRDFIMKPRGILGDSKLRESQYYFKNSSAITNEQNHVVLQNPRRSLTDKRSPEIDAVFLDAFCEKEKVLMTAKILPRGRARRFRAENFGEEKMRVEKKSKRNLNPSPQNPNPELPMNFRMRIRKLTGSVDVMFVFEKTLFESDTIRGQNRFLIPFNQVKKNFLTEEEKEVLKSGGKIGNGSIETLLIEPSLQKSKINLRIWDMSKSSNYALVTSWYKFVINNNLAKGTTVQLWSFRRGTQLCFALVNRGIKT